MRLEIYMPEWQAPGSARVDQRAARGAARRATGGFRTAAPSAAGGAATCAVGCSWRLA